MMTSGDMTTFDEFILKQRKQLNEGAIIMLRPDNEKPKVVKDLIFLD